MYVCIIYIYICMCIYIYIRIYIYIYVYIYTYIYIYVYIYIYMCVCVPSFWWILMRSYKNMCDLSKRVLSRCDNMCVSLIKVPDSVRVNVKQMPMAP